MKQMTIPKSAFYLTLSEESKKSSPIKIGQKATTVDGKLDLVLIDCYGYSKNRNTLHISKVTCYEKNPIFLATPCWCIRFKDGKVASISKHLPYQGDCRG
jgi:hypothetical protein